MTNSKFISLPKHFAVSVDEADGHFLLSTNDQATILKVDKSSIIKEGEEHLVRLGTPVNLIKGIKPTMNNERVELEVYNVDGCSDGKNIVKAELLYVVNHLMLLLVLVRAIGLIAKNKSIKQLP